MGLESFYRTDNFNVLKPSRLYRHEQRSSNGDQIGIYDQTWVKRNPGFWMNEIQFRSTLFLLNSLQETGIVSWLELSQFILQVSETTIWKTWDLVSYIFLKNGKFVRPKNQIVSIKEEAGFSVFNHACFC